MELMPLMDRRGDATAWADRNSGWVSDRIGNVFALVSFDSVFNQTGAQIGWWYGDQSGTATVASSWFDRAPKSKTSMCLAQKGFHDPRCSICHRVIEC